MIIVQYNILHKIARKPGVKGASPPPTPDLLAPRLPFQEIFLRKKIIFAKYVERKFLNSIEILKIEGKFL